MSRRLARGFTLIELMIVVAIIAIIAALAYFNYGRYAYRTRRADGREMLMRVAAAEERYFTNFNTYAASITNAAPAGLGFANAQSDNKNYTITVALANGNASYTLTATPVGVQVRDTCGALTLTDTGIKQPSGSPGNNGSCW